MTQPDPPYAVELRRLAIEWSARLELLDDADASRRPAPGKWSIKEIIGHLIDSASNNHQRFVRARTQDSLVFTGYDQDVWVESQRYGTASWLELLSLWRSYNLHLARVMTMTPAEVRLRQTTAHNFGEIGFRAASSGAAMTLAWLMEDYVEHFKHHMTQIRALLPG
jgi:hypothetical protein